MAIRVALNHKTYYRYDKPVWLSPHVVRLRPAPHCRTPIVSYSLKITPAEHFINWQQDPYSNRLARLVFPKKTKEFGFEVDLIAEMTVINPFDFFLEKSAEQFPFEYDAALARELTPYLETLPLTDKVVALVELHRAKDVRTIDHIVAVNQDIQRHVKYLIRLEPGIQTPEETLTLGCGSCRDSAWLAVQVWRQLGVAARFVSGYLIQLAPVRCCDRWCPMRFAPAVKNWEQKESICKGWSRWLPQPIRSYLRPKKKSPAMWRSMGS